MKRLACVLLALACLSYPLGASDDDHGRRRGSHRTLHLVEATIDELQDALEKRLVTSEQLVEIFINPDAEQEARALDRRRPHARQAR